MKVIILRNFERKFKQVDRIFNLMVAGQYKIKLSQAWFMLELLNHKNKINDSVVNSLVDYCSHFNSTQIEWLKLKYL